jgi:hypothetical protein
VLGLKKVFINGFYGEISFFFNLDLDLDWSNAINGYFLFDGVCFMEVCEIFNLRLGDYSGNCCFRGVKLYLYFWNYRFCLYLMIMLYVILLKLKLIAINIKKILKIKILSIIKIINVFSIFCKIIIIYLNASTINKSIYLTKKYNILYCFLQKITKKYSNKLNYQLFASYSSIYFFILYT